MYRNGELEIQVAMKNEHILIGRSERCDFRINDPTVSRLHALIYPSETGHALRNLCKNGTRVNGDKVEGDRPLVLGDRIYLGSRVALVYQGEKPAAYEEVALSTLVEGHLLA